MRLSRIAFVLATLFFVRPALADDAATTIGALDSALIDVMKGATKLGYHGRYDKLAPVLEKTFNLPLMARISVGPQWASLTPDQQAKVTEAFTALSIATYAARFDGYDGEQLQIVGTNPIASGDQLVNTKID